MWQCLHSMIDIGILTKEDLETGDGNRGVEGERFDTQDILARNPPERQISTEKSLKCSVLHKPYSKLVRRLNTAIF